MFRKSSAIKAAKVLYWIFLGLLWFRLFYNSANFFELELVEELWLLGTFLPKISILLIAMVATLFLRLKLGEKNG